nr:hypothetical protein BaRGS_006718 [Batillaria attramentaria]
MGDHCGQSLHNHGYNVSDADASCKDESGKASDSYHSMPGRPNTNRPSSTQNQYGFCDYPRPQMHSGVPDTSGRRRGHGGGLPSSQGVVMPDDRHVRSPGGPRLIGVTPENQGLDAHEMIIAPGTRNPIGNGRALVDSGTQ